MNFSLVFKGEWWILEIIRLVMLIFNGILERIILIRNWERLENNEIIFRI